MIKDEAHATDNISNNHMYMACMVKLNYNICCSSNYFSGLDARSQAVLGLDLYWQKRPQYYWMTYNCVQSGSPVEAAVRARVALETAVPALLLPCTRILYSVLLCKSVMRHCSMRPVASVTFSTIC